MNENVIYLEQEVFEYFTYRICLLNIRGAHKYLFKSTKSYTLWNFILNYIYKNFFFPNAEELKARLDWFHYNHELSPKVIKCLRYALLNH